MIPIFSTKYKGEIQVEIYMWALHHKFFLFQKSRDCFRYVPYNEIKGGILGCTTSVAIPISNTVMIYEFRGEELE